MIRVMVRVIGVHDHGLEVRRGGRGGGRLGVVEGHEWR